MDRGVSLHHPEEPDPGEEHHQQGSGDAEGPVLVFLQRRAQCQDDQVDREGLHWRCPYLSPDSQVDRQQKYSD